MATATVLLDLPADVRSRQIFDLDLLGAPIPSLSLRTLLHNKLAFELRGSSVREADHKSSADMNEKQILEEIWEVLGLDRLSNSWSPLCPMNHRHRKIDASGWVWGFFSFYSLLSCDAGNAVGEIAAAMATVLLDLPADVCSRQNI